MENEERSEKSAVLKVVEAIKEVICGLLGHEDVWHEGQITCLKCLRKSRGIE